ncbi:MAG: hypothetical protein KCHDKBKB_02239 [Elusimicrobia bacterium]|nr:hypothetical protein [Elusimicrobiota bacterium]
MNRTPQLLRAHVFVWAMFIGLLPLTSAFAERKFTVGIVTDGPAEKTEEIKSAFLKELTTLTENEFQINAPPTKQWNGNWSAKGIEAALDQANNDRNVDAVLVLGFAASQQAAQRKTFRKSTFAPFVTNALKPELPQKGEGSGISNLNYLTTETRFADVIKSFRSVASFKRLAVLVDEALYQSIQNQSQMLIQQAGNAGIEIKFVTHSGESDFAAKIPSDVQAVLVAPLPRLNRENRQDLIDALLERKLPSFSATGEDDLFAGLLASNVASGDLDNRIRQMGLNVHAVMRGEKAESQPVLFERKIQLAINMKTARAIGLAPKWDVLQNAVLVNEEFQMSGTELTISSAAQEAVRVNLDVIAGQLGVKAGKSEVKVVRSVLFPQLEGTLNYAARNDDYPYITSGLLAKDTISGSLKLNQVIFSESALANLSVQKKLQVSLEAQQRALELDIVQQAVTKFLDVLISQNQLEVQKNGVQLAQENLRLARSRVSAGKSDASDVARWESEIATARVKVLSAKTGVEQAHDRLNVLLHRPLADRYPLQKTGMDNPQLLISRPEFFKTVDNDQAFQRLIQFFIKEGLRMSPDLAQLDARVQAEERQLSSEKWSLIAPNLSLTGLGYQVFDEERLSSSNLQLEDKDYWQLGVDLSLPILEGGGRLSRISKSKAIVSQLRAERDSLSQNIEQLIRDNLHALQASYPSIRLSQDAAKASQRNYSLVSKNYARGTRSIVDLLDAQNNSLEADQRASNAVFVALTDLMNLQRSLGQSNFLIDREKLNDTMKRLQEFVNQEGQQEP